jgi:HlyD family secretion protein
MKKIIFFTIVIAALLSGAFLWWRRPVENPPERWLGYVEGEALYIAAPISGTLVERPNERGMSVQKNAPLFTLNPVTSDADTLRLRANLDRAQAQLQSLMQQRQRQPELAVARARQQSARAEINRAQKDFNRIAALAKQGYVTKARLEATEAALLSAKALLVQTRAEEEAGRLSTGREDDQRSAKAAVAAAEAELKAQVQRRSDIAPVAPAAGLIEQTFYNVGEWVPANAPVLALLPADKRKLRFFVPETRIATLRPGTVVKFRCDGCGEGGDAVVSYIAPRAEFTPPIIYSERARAKFVFMVEARLPENLRTLPVGLPVELMPDVGQ